MAERLFIIAAPGRENKAAEVEQILREYDFDVVNPRIVQDYEKEKARLGLFDDNFGWERRDVKLMADCDGFVVLDESETVAQSDYEEGLYCTAQTLTWMLGQSPETVDEWIAESDV